MRRRIKPKVVWLPSTNNNSIGTAGNPNSSQYQVAFTNFASDSTGNKGQIELDVVKDGSQSDPLSATSSLADIESSGYRLRRIVGKIYCLIPGNSNAPTTNLGATILAVTAGFMIRRVNQQNGISVANAASPQLVDPGLIENGMDPWIWRRTWLLGDNTNIPVGEILMPSTNFGQDYPGGIAEGPHVDQKTARIVGPEERLFLDLTATVVVQGDLGSVNQLFVVTDLRVLASMRTNVGNRRNASR